MKLNKIAYALSLLAVTAFTASCGDDEYEYQSPSSVGHEEVYFGSELSEQVDLSVGETSFAVTLSRVSDKGTITVPIEISDESGLFTLANNSVTFAEGEKTAEVVVNYDPTKFEYEDYKEVTITVNDPAHTSEYGVSSYSFKVGLPAP